MKRRFLKLTMLLVMLGAAKAHAVQNVDVSDPGARVQLTTALMNIPDTVRFYDYTGDNTITLSGYLPWIDEDVEFDTDPTGMGDLTLEWHDNSRSYLTIFQTYDSPTLQVPDDLNFDVLGEDMTAGIFGEDDLLFTNGFGSDVKVVSQDGPFAGGLVAGEDLWIRNFANDGDPGMTDGSFYGNITVAAQSESGFGAAGMIAGAGSLRLRIPASYYDRGRLVIDYDLGGTISVNADLDHAYGLYGEDAVYIGRDVKGSVTVTSGNPTWNGSEWTYGDIFSGGDNDHAYGIYSGGNIWIGFGDPDLQGFGDERPDYDDLLETPADNVGNLGGTFNIWALDDHAYGLFGEDNIYVANDVNGTFNVTAGFDGSGEDNFGAYGMKAGEDIIIGNMDNGTGSLDATMNITSWGDRAVGLSAYWDDIEIGEDLGGTINVTAHEDEAFGLFSGDNTIIGNDLSANINVEAKGSGAFGLFSMNNIEIGNEFSGTVNATAGDFLAVGLFAGDDLEMGGDTFTGAIHASAGEDFAAGIMTIGGIYGAGESWSEDNGYGPPYDNAFVIDGGTITAEVEEGEDFAAGILAWDGMNLEIRGESLISGTSGPEDDPAIALLSRPSDVFPLGGDPSPDPEDKVVIMDTSRLVGSVFLGGGEDFMAVMGEAKIDSVPVLDGGEDIDDLRFIGWEGTLGDEVTGWEDILVNGSVVNMGADKTILPSDGEDLTMTVVGESRVVSHGTSPSHMIIGGDVLNAAVIDLLDDEANDIFEITGNYTSDSGELWLDADLSSSDKTSDERLIVGEDAIGTTTVTLNNVDSHVAVTEGDGIEIVTVGEDAAPDAFVLGNPNDFGPFAVEINQGGEDNWYVQSPGYREEAAVMQAVTPFMSSLGYDSVMKFFERRAYGWFRRDAGEKESWWVRTTGSKYKLGLEGDAATEIDGYSGWFQVGADLIADGDKGTRFDLGLFAGVGYNTADVAGIRSSDDAGEIEQTAYGVGAYMSVHERGAWYLDAVAQAIYSDLSIDYLTADKVKPDEVWSYVASIEFGGCMSAGDSFRIEPQAQLIYQYTEDINLSTLVGDVTIDDYEGLQGRVSLAGVFGKCETDLNPFFEITAIRDFSEGNVVKYLDDTVELTSESEDWFLGGTIGLSQALSANNDVGYYLKAGGMWGLDGLDSYDYSLTAGLKKAF